MKIRPQVDNQQPITILGAKISDHKCFPGEDSAINVARVRVAQNDVCLAKTDQIFVQTIRIRVFFPLGKIELRMGEGRGGARVHELILHFRSSHAAELSQKRLSSVTNSIGEVAFVIAEKEKW